MILTDISLKRPVFATVTILALVVLGFTSYIFLNVDEWPDVQFPFVTVQVVYKGASPEQVDSKIIQKVEEAVGTIAGVNHIYSTAREGVATTVIEFTLETLPATAAQDVRDKIGKIRGDLPQDAEEPVIMRFDPTEAPIMSIAVSGDLSVREMTTLVNDVIKRRLETISGVGAIDIRGQLEREIHIDLERDKVAAYGLTIAEIAASLRAENIEVPGGKLTSGKREVNLRTAGNVPGAEDFKNLPLARRNGVQLYVSHVATVKDTTEEPQAITTLNGKPAIGLDIMKQSGANTIKVADDVKKSLATLSRQMPPGVELTLVRDNSKAIRESVDDVIFSMAIGGLLAVVVVFIYLGNWRSTLISAIAIPTSIIATFFTMKLLDFTINTMSLLGLSLAVGILIDDAIVVIENIVRHMEMGKSKLQAAADATREIGLAVTATTLTLVAVFVPVGMMTGITGRFFKQFGITVAFSVLVSLLVAFTLTPMLSANLLDIAHGQKNNLLGRFMIWWNKSFDRLTARYSQLLARSLRHRVKVLAIAAVFFAASLACLPLLGSSFLSRADIGEFSVWADVDPGASVEGSGDIAARLTEIIRTMPEVVHTYSVADVDTIKIFVKTIDKSARKRSVDAIIADLRPQVAKIPGIKASFVVKGGLMESKEVQASIRGESLDVLAEIAEKVHRIMEEQQGAIDIVSSYKPGKPDARVLIKRDQATDLGVSTASIADTLRTMFNGLTVNQFKDGDDRFDVVVRLAQQDRRSLDDLTGIYLAGQYKDKNDKTVMVPLSQVTETVYAITPSEIRRFDRQKEIRLTANLTGTSLGEFNKKFLAGVKQLDLPAGYDITMTGDSKNMSDAFISIALALTLAVIFIFFVLAAQYESYLDPFCIMLSLPLAIIGAILGLMLMKSDLSVMSLIGVIMLMGIVTKNAVLLIDYTKQLREEGLERDKALVTATETRMRPIMMTTLSTVFGMLPLALGVGPGAEARAPMAYAIIGGLLTSTVLTLVVVPVVYSLLDDLRARLGLAGVAIRK